MRACLYHTRRSSRVSPGDSCGALGGTRPASAASSFPRAHPVRRRAPRRRRGRTGRARLLSRPPWPPCEKAPAAGKPRCKGLLGNVQLRRILRDTLRRNAGLFKRCARAIGAASTVRWVCLPPGSHPAKKDKRACQDTAISLYLNVEIRKRTASADFSRPVCWLTAGVFAASSPAVPGNPRQDLGVM